MPGAQEFSDTQQVSSRTFTESLYPETLAVWYCLFSGSLTIFIVACMIIRLLQLGHIGSRRVGKLDG